MNTQEKLGELELPPTPTYDTFFVGEYKDIRLEKRRVVCAACRLGYILLAGARHFDAVMISQMAGKKFGSDAEQGFIDQFGIFLTRQEAFILAKAKGQIKNEPCVEGVLFSEDLY